MGGLLIIFQFRGEYCPDLYCRICDFFGKKNGERGALVATTVRCPANRPGAQMGARRRHRQASSVPGYADRSFADAFGPVPSWFL
jgi:hypothetical protein